MDLAVSLRGEQNGGVQHSVVTIEYRLFVVFTHNTEKV